jgi:hypothetical protein
MHYFICQPIDTDKSPFVVMTDSVGHGRLVLGAKRGESAMQDAMRRVFGESCQFARITAEEYFAALRAARDGTDGTDGGKPVMPEPVPPTSPPRGKRNALQQRMAMSMQP